ncbi:rCG35713 [Rattus norvegicus]|uniref:RCG35713 n=1 Tax=Rattus norvegicus TaxID=10116 RepID=A6IKT8_RAT|nr:rCG35713 [Rattus norvegicus]
MKPRLPSSFCCAWVLELHVYHHN